MPKTTFVTVRAVLFSTMPPPLTWRAFSGGARCDVLRAAAVEAMRSRRRVCMVF
jgi:hypothetical protein